MFGKCEVYSASAHRWYPARVAQVDEEGTLTVLFYIDGEAVNFFVAVWIVLLKRPTSSPPLNANKDVQGVTYREVRSVNH
eukprot:1690802-Amphidinium_carterae.1